jgi:outer membrane biogenesis lipoprotein LolB
MTVFRIILLASALFVLSACSGDEPAENVFKAQTDALGKAEEANKLLEEAAEAQRKAIDAQGR